MSGQAENQNQEKKERKDIFKPFNDMKRDKNSKPRFNSYWIYLVIILAFLSINFFNLGQGPKETSLLNFKKEMLKTSDVEKLVVINKERVEVYIKQERLNEPKYKELFEKNYQQVPQKGPHYYFSIPSVEIFDREINDAQKDLPEFERISVTYEEKSDFFGILFSYLLIPILLIVFWIFLFRRMSGGGMPGAPGSNIFNVGKSKARMFDKETGHKINFNDVAGLVEAKIELKEIVDFLKNPNKYTELGGKIPRGALLVGPPGTGKTLLAKAVAGEANVPFFSMSGSDFVEMFVGVGASRVRDLFAQAKSKAPCIIFIDEIDAVGRARGRNPNFGSNDERENTLNQLLTEMDGFAPNTGIIVLAATNRADILDRALMRAGRFDRQIHVELPDIHERHEIFQVHTKPIKQGTDIDLGFLAKQTPGFSGADIANVCNEAALVAARKDKKVVEKQDFLDAIDRIIGGLEKKNKIVSTLEKKTIAFHEAGHATVSWLLEHANPLIKVTIIPRGRSLGAAWYLPEERQITTTEQLLDEMCAALGGRAAEEVVFNKISTGALNDLERVTKQAFAMVAYFGMSDKIGNVSYYDSSNHNEYSFGKPYSEQTGQTIDTETKRIVEEQFVRAKEILRSNREGLKKLANILLEKEVIFSDDLELIFGKRKGHKEEHLTELNPTPESENKAIEPTGESTEQSNQVS